MSPKKIVFVHGWSVTSTDTYGELPQRLAAEAAQAGEPVVIADLWLSRYVSFRDEVRMPDLAWAMECAVRREFGDEIDAGGRFAVITHSTGGPVARAWWLEFYAQPKRTCPMSHLVMLALPLWRDRAYIHDAMTLVLVRVVDSEGYPVADFDLVLTGNNDNPDHLPEGFLADRQRNLRAKNTLTFFLNHDLMVGCDEVDDPREPDKKVVLRPEQKGVDRLGLVVTPRPVDGLVHYLRAAFAAEPKLLADVVRENETTMVEIVLRRVVREGVFRIGHVVPPFDFKNDSHGEPLPPQPQ